MVPVSSVEVHICVVPMPLKRREYHCMPMGETGVGARRAWYFKFADILHIFHRERAAILASKMLRLIRLNVRRTTRTLQPEFTRF